MISVKAFVAQNAIWHRATPTLEHFTRWVNAHTYAVGKPVPRLAGDPNRSSMVAETAFEAVARRTPLNPDIESYVFDFLMRLPRPPGQLPTLTPREKAESHKIQLNLEEFLDKYARGDPEFRPVFPGCGAVETAQGDILAGQELIEVKTVQRGFRGTDFRQALTYLAMSYAAGKQLGWITLLNPRRGMFFTASSQDLALDIGAGSSVGLMQDLVEMMTGFDVSG